jgi:hypothetical protein
MRLMHCVSILLYLLCGCTSAEERSSRPTDGEGGGTLPPPAIVEDFQALAPLASCGVFPGPGWLRSLTPTATGGFVALSEDGNSVALLDQSLRARASVDLPRRGDRGIQDPVDAWLLRDTLVVADGGGRALHLLPWADSAGDFQRFALPFVPHALVPLDRDLGVVPLGGSGGTLLFRLHAGNLLPLPLPPPSIRDPRLRILAGALEATLTGEGVVVLAHPLLVPSIHRVEGGSVIRTAAPIPEGQRNAVGRIPPAPFDEEDIMGLLAPSLDLAPGPEGSLLVLTRSGEWRRGFREKAVLQLRPPGMEVVGAVRLPVNAQLLAGGASVALRVMDGDGSWYRCDAPHPLVVADPVPSRHGADGG